MSNEYPANRFVLWMIALALLVSYVGSMVSMYRERHRAMEFRDEVTPTFMHMQLRIEQLEVRERQLCRLLQRTDAGEFWALSCNEVLK